MVLLTLLAAAARASCVEEQAPDAPFTVKATAPRVLVILELWGTVAPAGWTERLLDVLDARNLPAMVVTPVGPPSDGYRAVLERAQDSDQHDVAVVLPRSAVPRTPAAAKALKRSTSEVGAGRVRTVIAPVGSRTVEGLLTRAGFRSMVDSEGPATAESRPAAVFEGQPRMQVVLPPGPYEDQCGSDPRVGPFTPGAADRATTAIVRASRAKGVPVVRVALDGLTGREDDAVVLARWLDEVVVPSGVQVVTAEEARMIELRAFRLPSTVTPPAADGGGRMVGPTDIDAAARALVEGETLPRLLPGDLNPTEAFLAFASTLAGRVEGGVVRLRSLSGPASAARSSLTGPTELSSEAVRAAASGLLGALPAELPAAFPVDGRLLTAGELLVAFASAVRGDEPVVTRPIVDPDPNQRGLGWGTSTLP